MIFDETDKKILRENFDDDMISSIDCDNLIKIYNYLVQKGIYYVKDLILSSLDLFLLPYDLFVSKFEKLIHILGDNYVEKLGEDTSLIEIMYRGD